MSPPSASRKPGESSSARSNELLAAAALFLARLKRSVYRVHDGGVWRSFEQLGDLGFCPRQIPGGDEAPRQRHARLQIRGLRLAGFLCIPQGRCPVAGRQAQPGQLDLRRDRAWVEPQHLVVRLDGIGHFPAAVVDDGQGEMRGRRLRVGGNGALARSSASSSLFSVVSHCAFMTSTGACFGMRASTASSRLCASATRPSA